MSKTHCSAQNLGLGAQTADHWVLVVEEITQLDMALWADLTCVGLNADVKFLYSQVQDGSSRLQPGERLS